LQPILWGPKGAVPSGAGLWDPIASHASQTPTVSSQAANFFFRLVFLLCKMHASLAAKGR